MPFEWLEYDQVVFINEYMIDSITPSEPKGVINPNGLESALARGETHHHYEGEKDVFMLAALISWSIVQNHPFANANKRTAYMVAVSFLEKHGYVSDAPSDEVQDAYVRIANGEMNEEELADWLRDSSYPGDGFAWQDDAE